MKKVLALLLAAVMIFSLAACGNSGSNTGTTAAAESTGASGSSASYTDQELCDLVSGAVLALVKDGTYAAIGEKYPDIKDYLSLTEADAEGANIPEKGSGNPDFTFKHGFDLDYPPYSYLQDDGSVGGFDVEMCQAVCEYMGWKYQSVPFNWDAKDMELNAKSCDCIWSGFTKEGREDEYTWGVTYSVNIQMIMVPADSDIKTLADLAGKNVGVQISTSAAEMLEDEEGQKALADTFGQLLTYETYTVAFNDLKAGAIDAIAIDVTAGSYLMSSDGSGNYKFLDESLGEEHYAIGFRK